MPVNENTVQQHVLSNTDLAFERTLMAENRTLMAWIRTAISLISFGFTIYKIFQETLHSPGASKRLLSPREVGMMMIAFGMLALFWGLKDHMATIKKLRKSYPALQRTNTSVLAILVLLFGVLLFVVALFRQ